MRFFNIATNLTNGPFMIGYESDITNFYIKGEIVEDRPLVSCRIFDSKGRFIFSMERNKVLSKEVEIFTESNTDSLIISDKDMKTILKIDTRNERKKRITYIEGQFYDKNGRLAARGDERGLIVNCPLRM